jgi:hypothetical protein
MIRLARVISVARKTYRLQVAGLQYVTRRILRPAARDCHYVENSLVVPGVAGVQFHFREQLQNQIGILQGYYVDALTFLPIGPPPIVQYGRIVAVHDFGYLGLPLAHGLGGGLFERFDLLLFLHTDIR